MQFRQYPSQSDDPIYNFYLKQRQYQTLSFVKYMHHKYHHFTRKLTMDECFSALNNLTDISDPDMTLPNIHHLLQTAEAIRHDGHPDWFQLVGLIHDLGKLIYLKGCDEDGTSIKEQWAIVGDTFVVGCQLSSHIVYPEFNIYHPDNDNTPLGIYQPNCGLDNCHLSYGHDEFMYQVLKHNNSTIPEEGLYIIRYHSLYPWHKYNEYQQLMNQKDKEYLPWVKLFNGYDLYTKEDREMNVVKLMEYYKPIFIKYIGDHLYI